MIKYPNGVLVIQFYQFSGVFTGVEEITMSANRDAVNNLVLAGNRHLLSLQSRCRCDFRTHWSTHRGQSRSL
jgi:hypothetical protein